MKRFKSFLILLLMISFAFATENEIMYLSGTGSDATVSWDFMVTGGRQANEWTTIPVPSNWELQGFGSYNYGHDKPKADETGIYKHRFTIPQTWQDKRVFIVFEGAMTDTKVEINGQQAGPIHQGGFYRFDYDITTLLNIEGENELVATVNKMSANESINQAERQSDYWVFGGIYRPVYLKAVPQEFIEWTAIDAQANGDFLVNVHFSNLKKADKVVAQVIQKNGQVVGAAFSTKIKSDTMTTLRSAFADIKTWTAETPNLYYVDISLMDGKKVLHTVRERFGFRTIEVRDGKGIFLNGQHIVLKGCDRHSFWPSTGRALNRNRCRKDVLTLKEMNMNAVRMSHYPPDTWFLDLCDELGLYVLDELAGWQKPPYDTPTGKRLVKQIVKRDVNHPSIVFWDNGNEGGWNNEINDEWAKYDPQNRRVLHPWELFNGVDTDHYENYETTIKKMQSGNIFMPTEYLHGLYDGGHGAGLDDMWRIMWGNPLNGGMFLWVYADEGIVRTDQNGRLDTDGNHAPDGIVGPYHEREASFYTIKEIWCPVYIETNEPLPHNFNGKIPVENRYDFTNLNECTFSWSLQNFAKPGDETTKGIIMASGTVQGPDIPARGKGFIQLPLEKEINAEQLVLTAFDKNDNELYTWRWALQPSKLKVEQTGATPNVVKDKISIIVKTDLFTFKFDKNTGLLENVKQGQHTIPFNNGPVFTGPTTLPQNVKIAINKTENAIELDVSNHPDFSKLTWTINGNGWVDLDYAYNADGEYSFCGISFNYPEHRMQSMKWLGKGPYRVWKNREKGVTKDVWFNTYNNFAPNTAWDYPEFPGYYADVNWVVFNTDDGPITMLINDDNKYLRTYTQSDAFEPRHTKTSWPNGDISVLECIPAIGTKFRNAEQYGPQSQKTKLEGIQKGSISFYFGHVSF